MLTKLQAKNMRDHSERIAIRAYTFEEKKYIKLVSGQIQTKLQICVGKDACVHFFLIFAYIFLLGNIFMKSIIKHL